MNKSIAQWQAQENIFFALPDINTDWAPYLEDILDSYEDLVSKVCKFEKVILISSEAQSFERFKKYENVEFMQIPINDTWIRDFGPIDFIKDDKIASYNFKFNAWGGKFEANLDNAVNEQIFKNLKGDLIDINLELEGGSIDFNGQGVMLTTSECLLNANRGSRDKNFLDKVLKKLFGLEEIIWLDHGFILGDDTDSHIDTLARFVNENTIVYMVCDDESDIHYSELKSMEEELRKTKFNLVPLYLPKAIFYDGKRLGATYCNFIFINNALIMPIYGDDEADKKAIETMKNLVKDREIIPVRAEVFLRQNGSLHCSSQIRYAGKR